MSSIRLKALAASVAFAHCFMIFGAHAQGESVDQHAPDAPMISKDASLTKLADEEFRRELANVASRLISVESSIASAADRADQVAQRTSRYSLYTVLGTALLTALVSLLSQGLFMRHQRIINRIESEAKVANSYVEWQLQQLSKLYGPIRALLGQSNVLYRQMNKALVAADPSRFRLIPGEDFDNLEFQIMIDGQWLRFRTVKHFAEVYKKGYGVEPYFDDVIEVGERLADTIREKAGFARPEDNDLVHVMGDYLAHYLVLKRLHNRIIKGEALHLSSADEQAVFPNKIQKLVDEGFHAINKQVIEWRGLETT